MPFWLFKKKRIIEPTINVIATPTFEDNLKLSFYRIKSDIQVIRDWLDLLRNKDQENTQKIKEIDQKLDQITDIMAYLQSSQDTFKSQITQRIDKIEQKISSKDLYYSDEINPFKSEAEPLTLTQQTLFVKTALLLKELNQEWISFRLLAQEAYPGKEYRRIKSTLSEYINILIESNLIKSQRKGRVTYLALTEKGKRFVKESKEPVAKEIKKKSKEVNKDDV